MSITWTARTVLGAGLFDVVYAGNNTFVGLTGVNYIARATDSGITWTAAAISAMTGFASIATDGAGTVVAVGGASAYANNIQQSSNYGATFASAASPFGGGSFPNNAAVTGVAYGNGVFVCSSHNSTTGAGAFARSTNGGTTWTLATTIPANFNDVSDQGMSWDGTNFIAVGQINNTVALMQSSDLGVTWTTVTAPAHLQGIGRVAYGNGKYVSANSNGPTVQVATTLAGLATASATATGLSGTQIATVQYCGGLFIATDSTAQHIATSPDGVTWTLSSVNFSVADSPYGFAFGNNTYVAVGSAGGAISSGVSSGGGSVTYVGGFGDITDPGAWEDPEGNIPPLAFQNVPQTVNYPLNGDGRYWFIAGASSPTPDPITFIGDPNFLVDNGCFQATITQAATDGSELFMAYSLNNGSTFTPLQLGPSLQNGSLLSLQLIADLLNVTTFIFKVYSTGGTASATTLPWNVAVAITRNANEKLLWDSPNPYDPVSYNCECMDSTVYTQTLLQLRTRMINRLGFEALLTEVSGQTLLQMQTTVMNRVGFANQTANPPPGILAMMASIINEAQQTLYTRYAQGGYSDGAPAILVNPTDTISLNNIAVQILSVALAKMHYGQPDGATLMKSFETYLAELYKRSPPNLVPLLNDFLFDSQSYLYRRYSQLHTRRMFRWKVNPMQRFYSLKDNDEDVLCNFQMDPMKQIEWAGIQDTNNVWYELIEGIEPQLYTMIDKPWRPARYEIRQCIELYPAPDQTYWLWMKAHFGLMSFSADTDSTTLDANLVFMHALANAKAHYNQPDANNIEAQANSYRKELIAGTHGTNRYIPATQQVPPAVRPTLVSYEGNGAQMP